MPGRGFSHLHVHSEYSILDGLIRIEELIAWTKEHGKDYVALTDHGNMYGAVHFFKAAKEAGLKPIIGIEAYISPTNRFDKELAQADASNHIVLYVADSVGYKNLMKLTTLSFQEGFFYKPRIDLELLREYNEGIIATTACLKGRVNQLFRRGHPEDARKVFEEYLDIFGKDRLFIEYMNNGMPEQVQLKPYLEKLSDDYGIPIIATNDAHYVKLSDAPYQDVMLCIQTKAKLKDTDRMRFPTNQFYLKTQDEMLDAMDGNSQWLENCDLVAKMVDFEMELGTFHFPNFETPDGSTSEEYLAKISHEGLKNRFQGKEVSEEYSSRLDYEIGWINKLSFAPYFLIIDDFVRYAIKKGISKGPGRGSGAGSLVSYALGITDVDPIKFDLLFERFINPARKSMPDMDLDFDPIRREEVIDYVREKYNSEYVCNIITFNRMKARAAIRDSARILDIPIPMSDRIAKMIPMGNTISEAMEETPELANLYKNDNTVRWWIDTAMAIEGLIRNEGVHPAGIVIANKPVVEYAPLMVSRRDNLMVCQYPMKDVDAIGLIKMDFLGLRTLTYMEDCINLVKETKGIEIKPMEIPLDDANTYSLLCEANTLGVFQLESSGMRSLMMDIRPDWIGDVIALIALYRPGPIKRAPRFAARKHKREKIYYAHPELQPILEETYGVITYQEQITMILVKLAGIQLTDAVSIIKIISKKRSADEINQYRDEFVQGTIAKGIAPGIANEVFSDIVEFAGYGFNKSHSAAYGLLAYWTAYLKANYPLEFYCSFLSSEMQDTDKIAQILGEIQRRKIEIFPPDVNTSFDKFTVENEGIRFGLVAIKGVGEQAAVEIMKARGKGGEFASLLDFTKRVDLHLANKGAIENLIKASAMDSLPGHRAQKCEALNRAIDIGKRTQEDKTRGQEQLFNMSSTADDDGMSTLMNIQEFSEQQMLRMEKKLTGFYLTGHPLERYRKRLEKAITHNIDELNKLEDDTEVTIGGLVSHLEFKTSQNNEDYAIMSLEDFTASTQVMVFESKLEKVRKDLIPEAVLRVKGIVRSETRETQSDSGDAIETRQVKLFLNSLKRYSKDTVEIDESDRQDIGVATVSHKVDKCETMELGYSSDESMPTVKYAELTFILPMETEKLREVGTRVRNVVNEHEGETRLNVYFKLNGGRFRIDLGLDSGCDYSKVREIIRKELNGARFNP
ncbi:DNA polymerase III subunit alpha [bacterium]|nr:DNA polymerase III subunit alpha [bacterium]